MNMILKPAAASIQESQTITMSFEKPVVAYEVVLLMAVIDSEINAKALGLSDTSGLLGATTVNGVHYEKGANDQAEFVESAS